MDVRTYRAATLQEALALVREDLGPTASVLHTREVRTARLLGLLPGVRKFEVVASNEVSVPSRLPKPPEPEPPLVAASFKPVAGAAYGADLTHGPRANDDVNQRLNALQAMVEDLCRRTTPTPRHDLPDVMFHAYTDLIEAEVPEQCARELVERLRGASPRIADAQAARRRLAQLMEEDIAVAGPIQLEEGRCRRVALIGPTGVGKTTTIAKLAANFRLRDKRRVGLITVDTYRIAAVEQLRTYAEIIDLPMQVVATPREMRQAVRQMAHLDLVLLDTAGRSPKDDVKIQELQALLAECEADEIHLVLSSVASQSTLTRTAERFMSVGATALLLTKLDEATHLGSLLPLLKSSGLPLSYLTNGQNVPDDIIAADAGMLSRELMNLTSA